MADGPVNAAFNTLVCVLEDALIAAEHKLVELGEGNRVRDTRSSFQAAAEPVFMAAVEQILYRKVRAFASAVDVKRNVVFEVFVFETGKDGGEISALSEPAA